MPGTKQGYQKYKAKMIAKLGSEEAFKEHMKRISSKGGSVDHPRPFQTKPGLAQKAGKLGKPNKIYLGQNEHGEGIYVDKV